MSAYHDEDERFGIVGTGCWCPDDRTLGQMRHMGHTKECAQARRGWRLNYAHLRGIAYERAVAQEIGRQVLADQRSRREA